MGRYKKLPSGPPPSDQLTVGDFFKNSSGGVLKRKPRTPPRPIKQEEGSKRSIRYSPAVKAYALGEYVKAAEAARRAGNTAVRGVARDVVSRLKKIHPHYYGDNFSYKTLNWWLNPQQGLGRRGRTSALTPVTVSALENKAKELVTVGAGMVNSATFMPYFVNILS